jgi:hypothetical protein
LLFFWILAPDSLLYALCLFKSAIHNPKSSVLSPLSFDF